MVFSNNQTSQISVVQSDECAQTQTKTTIYEPKKLVQLETPLDNSNLLEFQPSNLSFSPPKRHHNIQPSAPPSIPPYMDPTYPGSPITYRNVPYVVSVPTYIPPFPQYNIPTPYPATALDKSTEVDVEVMDSPSSEQVAEEVQANPTPTHVLNALSISKPRAVVFVIAILNLVYSFSLFAGLMFAKVIGMEITTVKMFTLVPVLGLPIVAIIIAFISCLFATINAIMFKVHQSNNANNNGGNAGNGLYSLVSVATDSDTDSDSSEEEEEDDDDDTSSDGA